MTFASKIKHLFKPHESPRQYPMTEAEADAWIAERKAGIEGYTDEQLQAIAQATLANANIDREQFLREGEALREQLKRERSDRARHSPQ